MYVNNEITNHISSNKAFVNETHNILSSASKMLLPLKALNKNCSRRHFNFLLLSFEENKA